MINSKKEKLKKNSEDLIKEKNENEKKYKIEFKNINENYKWWKRKIKLYEELKIYNTELNNKIQVLEDNIKILKDEEKRNKDNIDLNPQ